MPTPTLSTRIATLALSTFAALPSKSKPRTYSSGTREWTPLSAIVLASSADTESEILTCVSLATGTKCLPVSSIPRCKGTVLHDCHAEVLALRGFNRWLLAEMERFLAGGYQSRWIDYQDVDDFSAACPAGNLKPFILRPNVSIHLFSSEAPCGDASMGLLIGSKAEEDSEAWAEPEPLSQASTSTPAPLHGRAYFSLLGTVRRKPSRADAEPTLSKSCTDKLALKQVTSVLAWPVSLFVQTTGNTFLKSMVLPAEKYDAVGFERAFGGGRFAGGAGNGRAMAMAMAMAIHHFEVQTLPSDLKSVGFAFAKPPPTASDPAAQKASNISALWALGPTSSRPLVNETLINGVKQGSQQFSPQSFKMSAVCRRRMWEAGRRVVGLLRLKLRQRQGADDGDEMYLPLAEGVLAAETYAEAKGDGGVLDGERRGAKEWAVGVLGGWVRNGGDEGWGLGMVEDV